MTREFPFRLHRARPAAALLLAGSALLGLGRTPAEASWVSANCYAQSNTTYNYNLSHWKRSQAKTYAYTAVSEGYQWGGGCWNNSNTDNTPGQPTSCSGSGSTGGEGPDCSGFTFKSWAMRTSSSDSGAKYWNALTNVHGPYTSTAFWNGAGPTTVVSKTYLSTGYMDAFASDGHIGMIYTEGSSNNQDTIIEAKSEANGTGIWTRTYRGSSAFRAVRRDNWTEDCYPQCI